MVYFLTMHSYRPSCSLVVAKRDATTPSPLFPFDFSVAWIHHRWRRARVCTFNKKDPFFYSHTTTTMAQPIERNQDATVYVGNLDDRCSDTLVWELMAQAGPIGKLKSNLTSVSSRCSLWSWVKARTRPSNWKANMHR